MSITQKIGAALILAGSVTIGGCDTPKEPLKQDLGIQPKEKVVQLYDHNKDGKIDMITCEGYNYPCCKDATSHKERYSVVDYNQDGNWDIIEGQTRHLFPEDRSGVKIVSFLVYNSPFGGRLDNVLFGIMQGSFYYNLYDTDNNGSIDKVVDKFGIEQPFARDINQLLESWKASAKKELESYKE